MADPKNPRAGRDDFTIRRPSLQPTLRPSFQFTPVAGGVSRETEELIRSLKGMSDKLDSTFAPILKEQRAGAAQEGAQAASTNQLKFAEAIEKGVIPETASPWFIKGWQQQEGRIEGLKYQIEQQTAWAKSDARNTDDADKIIGFQREFRKGYAERVGPNVSSDYLNGFHNIADVADAQLANQHIRHRQEEISNRVRENTGTEISAILARAGGDANKAAEEINMLGDKMKLDGLSPSDFRKIVAGQVIATAKLTGNIRHTDVLDRVKLENGQPLSTDAAVKKEKADLDYFLTQKARSNLDWAWRVEDRQEKLIDRERKKEMWARADEEYARNRDRWSREDFVRSSQSRLLSAVFADPENARVNAAPMLKELAARDPDAARTAASFVESYMTSSRTVDDHAEHARLRWDMIRSAGNPAEQTRLMREAMTLFGAGKLNASTVSQLDEDAQRWRTSNADRIIGSDPVRAVFAAADKLAQKNPTGLFGQDAANALLGQRLLRQSAIDFMTANPTALPEQLAEHLAKKLQTYTPIINPTTQGNAGNELQAQARAAQAGVPAPGLDKVADRVRPEVVKVLLDTVASAATDVDVARILAQFDELPGHSPGLARTIIQREAAKTRQQPKKK